MDQHWASDYLLLDGRSINLDAVHRIFKPSVHREICETLKNSLLHWQTLPMSRFDGNTIKAGDVMFVRSDVGIQLVEVSSVSGPQLRACILNSVCISDHNTCKVGDQVYARRNNNCLWQPGVITAIPSRTRVVVRRPSGIEDEKINLSRKNVRVFTPLARIWGSGIRWLDEERYLLCPTTTPIAFPVAFPVALPNDTDTPHRPIPSQQDSLGTENQAATRRTANEWRLSLGLDPLPEIPFNRNPQGLISQAVSRARAEQVIREQSDPSGQEQQNPQQGVETQVTCKNAWSRLGKDGQTMGGSFKSRLWSKS